MRNHFADFASAYNLAKRPKTLRPHILGIGLPCLDKAGRNDSPSTRSSKRQHLANVFAASDSGCGSPTVRMLHLGNARLKKGISGASAIVVSIVIPRIGGIACLDLQPVPWETMPMNTRLLAIATSCRELAIPTLALASIVVFGSLAIDNNDAGPTVDRLAPLAANAQFADEIASDGVRVEAPRSMAEVQVASATPVSRELFVTPGLTDSSEKLRSETSPEAAVTMTSVNPKPDDVNRAVDITSKCLLGDTCIDRYLWALYERTPKEDSVKSQEQRKMTLKKKGKRVTVTRTFTKLTDEDFSWKDPKAAQHAGMPLEGYVIGGMDRDFKWKLFQMLHVAEQAGLSPGITSAFRDNYRQSIASGLKAADDRSYHGGSLRGGYGHGLAADIVSINGATRGQRLISSELLWNWIDAHGKEFGIGRPYLDKDPPHVAPIDGKEYADHHPGMKARRVASTVKPRNSRDDRRASKHARAGRSAKVRTI